MKQIYVTRNIPEKAYAMLREKGYTVDVSGKDGILTREELLAALKAKPYDAVLCLLTDAIDGAVFDAVPTAKIFANYAVGFNNINLADAKSRGVVITNTPSVFVGEVVADHAFALLLAMSSRIVEGDRYLREGKYHGWDPMLLIGSDLKGKTLGLLGAGRIGEQVAHKAQRGFEMNVIYYDVRRNEHMEKEYAAKFYATPEEVLREADFVSLHVPLLDSTKHLINAERLRMMKPTSYLINTSRGPVVDEAALVDALKNGVIRGAGLDVFENEPALAPGLTELANVVMTPHTASATTGARDDMATLAANNIIAFFEGNVPPNAVQG